ncbi:GEVED domain-containing protein [Kaistella palustris]|uniref:GEVED domain-containing protein n=1 Tax=Kaistella palustris TaxID=493376 RepID=UPI0003F95C51|nr:GEVED domain-containing protein [Kaistella palustris]
MKKILLFASMWAIPMFGFGQTLLSENFQTGTLPATWTVIQTNTAETWHVEDPLGGTDYRATVNYDPAPAAQNEMLVSPSLDFTGYANFVLKAQIGLSYYWAVTPENNYDVFIKVSTDNGATWTQVWSEVDLGVFTNWVMNPVTVNLAAYAGKPNVKIAFQYVGNDGAALYVDNITVTVPAGTAPNCATPVSPANAATGINYTAPVPLTWTAPATGSTAESYDIYLDTNPNPTTLIGNSTSTTFNATGLAGSTTYYWKVIAKNGAGAATGCTTYSFTTSANPFAPYCGPLVYSNGVEPITSVSFGGMTNTSAAAVGGTNAHELFLDKIATVRQDGTFEIRLQGNTDGGFTNKFIVFIDWNQDGDFLDAGETYFDTAATTLQIVGSTGVDGKEAVGNIVVPAGALLGNTRMRIKKNFGSTFYPNPCFSAGTLAAGTNTGFGQAEDYTVTVEEKLGVSAASKAKMMLYPNPVKDILHINSDGQAVTEVSFWSVDGKLVKSVKAEAKNIDVDTLPKGVYIVKVKTAETEQSFKVIKD